MGAHVVISQSEENDLARLEFDFLDVRASGLHLRVCDSPNKDICYQSPQGTSTTQSTSRTKEQARSDSSSNLHETRVLGKDRLWRMENEYLQQS
jgi:hypothetical protein